METPELINASVNATKKVTLQNSNINSAIHFLKELTHTTPVSLKLENDRVGLSADDVRTISNFVAFLEDKRIGSYKLEQFLNNLNS